MPPCRKCGEDILFVQLKSGKYMPCDPDLELTPMAPGIVLVTPDGRVLRGSKATEGTKVQGYQSHYASCPYAEEFRR